jgi:hypothetical protein
MIVWAMVFLILSLLGTIIHIITGAPLLLLWNDVIILLVAVGMMFRIHYKAETGEKEFLRSQYEKLSKANRELKKRVAELEATK